jgi:hypothetical protein
MDVCKVLDIKPETLKYRLERGFYKDPKRLGEKRKFSEIDIREIIKTTEALIDKSIFVRGKNIFL